LFALLRIDAGAQEWTRFRGPNGTGISPAKGIPVTWTEQDYKWRIAFPGESHSQPVIWGDKLFLTTAVDMGKERALVCLNKHDGTRRPRTLDEAVCSADASSAEQKRELRQRIAGRGRRTRDRELRISRPLLGAVVRS
jgi:hypothetical protein